MAAELAIRAAGLTKSYGDRPALRGVSLEVNYGEVFAYLGRNGSGKTTTVRVLTGLAAPSSGEAWVAGKPLAELNKSAVGVTMQAASLDPAMTGREHLEFIAGFWGLVSQGRRLAVDENLARFGLAHAADRLISTYSGGMKRRLDLAGALLHRPKVLFLDEPTTGLDAQSRRALWEEVRFLQTNGSAVFLTTQYLEEAEELADNVAILSDGFIAAQGTPTALRQRLGRVELRITLDQDSSPVSSLSLNDGRVSTTGPDGAIRIPVATSEEAIDVLQYVRTRWPLRSARIDVPTLEDVFLDVTGRAVSESPPTLESVA